MNLKSSPNVWLLTPSKTFVKEDFVLFPVYLTIPFAWKEKIA